MKKYLYFFALWIWLSLFFLSACTPSQSHPQYIKLEASLHFSGVSEFESHRLSPLSAISFDDEGYLYSLVQDSGRITAFDATGTERTSFSPRSSAYGRTYSVEAIALGNQDDEIFVLDGKNGEIQAWKKDGRFIRSTPIAISLSPGDTAFGSNKAFYHNTEGLTDDSLIVVFDTYGKRTSYLGAIPETDTLLTPHKSLRHSLAEGEIPGFMKNSVLIAAGKNNRVYALHRTRPILKCFENGQLQYTRTLNFVELDTIREAAAIRNRLLEQPEAYIPFSYWSDITVDENGNIYLLLAMQTHHTIYMLDTDGNFMQKIIGDYGKGHLLAVQSNRLAIADAAKRSVSIYELPEPS
ncbi:MAG: hypothetical protein ACE5I1_16730 [bacterium]